MIYGANLHMVKSHGRGGMPCHCVEVGGGRLIGTEYGSVHEAECAICIAWITSPAGQLRAAYMRVLRLPYAEQRRTYNTAILAAYALSLAPKSERNDRD